MSRESVPILDKPKFSPFQPSFRFFESRQEAIVLRTIIFGLCALVFATCVFNADANAQATGCTIPFYCGAYSIWNPVCVPPIPPQVNISTDCVNIGPWFTLCQVQSNKCAPAAGPGEGCPGGCGSGGGNGSGGGRATASSPISLGTGNTYIEQTDVKIPGLGGGLVLARIWNSVWPSTQLASQVGLFGPNWRSTFEERVFVGGDHFIKYARNDASFWSFGWNGTTNGVAAPANVSATLSQGSTYWTLAFPSGDQKLFSVVNGSLASIIDRNGNTTQLSYDATNRLTTVTDAASRHLYFNYGSDTSRLVSTITSDFGISLTYSYDTQNRLIQVIKPDQTTLNFQYDANSMITGVTDSNGKVLESHTYDSNHRGLAWARANGVEAVTITYQ